jgi:septal ring factor EnvC (AmiA/AmiB activator)
MTPRSRSPRGASDAQLRELRAALAHAVEVGQALADARAELAAERAALAAAQAALAAERARAAALQWRWLDTLHSMAQDARELAVLAHRAGAAGDLIDRWYAAPPAPAEPEAEPEPR